MEVNLNPHFGHLKNGLRFILVPMGGANSVGISILVGVGARAEEKNTNGISHFLEHLVFKGTKNFPTQVSISEGIEGVGGILNGYTSSQVTNFWVKVLPQHFDSSFAILSDLVVNPLLRDQDIKREKGVIIEEIRMKDDNPSDEVMELSQKALWGLSGLGLPVLGSEKTIKGLVPEVVRRYHQENYHAGNTVICVAGKFDEEKALQSIKEKFEGLRPESRIIKTESPDYNRGKLVLKNKQTAQAHIVFSFPTFPFNSQRRYTLEIISSILGGGMSSRLFLNVRDKGLAYAVHCFTEFYCDSGGFFTYAGVEKERLALAIKTILSEFKNLADGKFSQDDVDKAREKIKGPLLFSLENPVKVAEFFGYQETAFKEIEQPHSYLTRLYKVSRAEIQSLSSEIFSQNNLSFAVISPFKEEKFKNLLTL